MIAARVAKRPRTGHAHPMLGVLALIATVCVVIGAAWGIAHLVGERRPFVTATLGLSLLIIGLAGFGRLTQSLVLATPLIVVSALVIITAAWRRAPPRWVPAVRMPGLGRWGTLGTALVFGLGSYCAFRGYWWDEYSGHYPFTAALARGILPMEHPLFPGEPFRYHYAFDLLAAWVRALTGLNVATALDVVSVAALALLLGTARDLGATLGGARLARVMPVMLTMATGTLLFLLYTDNGSIEVHWDLLPVGWRQSVPPPTISNFFQHPQALGMPMSLAVLMLFDRPMKDALHLRRAMAASVVMAALSLSQIVFFGTMGLTLGLTVLILGLSARAYRTLVIDGLLLLLSLAGAVALGGFLAPGPPATNMLVFGKSVFTDPPALQVAFHLVVFGIPLIALPWGLWRAAKDPSPLRLPIALSAVFGFLVPHFVTYERSWDIVKFFALGGFFANALLAETLFARPRPTNRWRTAGLSALVIACTFSSWIFILRMGVLDGHFGIPPMHFPPPSEVGRVVGERVNALAGRAYVFSTNVELARAAGTLTPGFDWRQVGQGFMIDQAKSLRLTALKQRAQRDLDPKSLAGLNVGWMVLTEAEVGWLSGPGRARLHDPKRFEAVERIQVGSEVRRIYRILPGALED